MRLIFQFQVFCQFRIKKLIFLPAVFIPPQMADISDDEGGPIIPPRTAQISHDEEGLVLHPCRAEMNDYEENPVFPPLT